jgi:radical SAM protein with 4Fe4S-binding SPASM domain
MLQTDLFSDILEQIYRDLIYINFYFQGEPYLNKDFLKMVKMAHQKKIYTSTSTNAHFLSAENCAETVDSGLNRLIISVDGAKQESYEKYRIGGQLTKVINGIKELIRWKRRLKSEYPFIELQFIIFRHNEDEIADIKELARELGVDKLSLKTAQIYDHTHGSDLIPEKSEYSRYEIKGSGRFQIRNHLFNHCWKMWHSCVITWDGKVVPCCFDKDAAHVLGDLKKDSFRDIWYGDDYQRFRQKILQGRREIDICTNCSEGTKVWV